MTENKRVHVIVEGRVQGVFFRAYTSDEAKKLGLTGWVRNRPEGTVEAVIEGDAGSVDTMLHWFYQGSPGSRVTKVRVSEEPPVGDSTTFEIHY
ncbi:MAG: acylphosphatase [Proteobacteria bacterium]|nr:acylphosphatase [Pseudomonadota bacterium]